MAADFHPFSASFLFCANVESIPTEELVREVRELPTVGFRDLFMGDISDELLLVLKCPVKKFEHFGSSNANYFNLEPLIALHRRLSHAFKRRQGCVVHRGELPLLSHGLFATLFKLEFELTND